MRLIFDDFLSTYEALREYADTGAYANAVADGKVYPDICTHVPEQVALEVEEKLNDRFGPVRINHMFLRMTTANTPEPPHYAHTDSSMGEWSLMLYLVDRGGTSFVRHKETGMMADPETPEEFAIWERDTKMPSKWEVWAMTKAKPNRACIFSSEIMHRAEPIGGYGNDATDGRIVLTAFFDLKEKEYGN